MTAFDPKRTIHSSAPFAAVPDALKAPYGLFGGIGVTSWSAHVGYHKSRSQLPVCFLNRNEPVAPRWCRSGLGDGGRLHYLGGTHTQRPWSGDISPATGLRRYALRGSCLPDMAWRQDGLESRRSNAVRCSRSFRLLDQCPQGLACEHDQSKVPGLLCQCLCSTSACPCAHLGLCSGDGRYIAHLLRLVLRHRLAVIG
jgi:hypothetical protein